MLLWSSSSTHSHSSMLWIKTIDGGPIRTGAIMLYIKPLWLQVSVLHVESIPFLVMTNHPITLGFPWIQQYDPQIYRQDKKITKCTKQRYHHCHVIASTTVESTDLPVTTVISEMEAFSKTKMSGLPHHRPYDCAINLLPGTMPPRNWLYSLSLTEQQPIEEYVYEALQ